MMKNKLLIIALLLISLTSCKKEHSGEVNIQGKWELNASTDGMTGKSTTYPTGNGTTLSFTNTTFEFYNEGKLVNSGNYQIVKEKSVLTQEIGDRIILNDPDGIRVFVSINDGFLSLQIDGFDAGATRYRRVKY